jgi:hypothetical protein
MGICGVGWERDRKVCSRMGMGIGPAFADTVRHRNPATAMSQLHGRLEEEAVKKTYIFTCNFFHVIFCAKFLRKNAKKDEDEAEERLRRKYAWRVRSMRTIACIR